MIKQFRDLIDEFGSSTVMKERLKLINDRYEALEEKLKNCESENRLLKQENESLNQKIVGLKTKINDAASSNVSLPDEQRAILAFFFKNPGHHAYSKVSRLVEIENQICMHHIDELYSQCYLEMQRPSDLPGVRVHEGFSLSKKGRKLCVDNEL